MELQKPDQPWDFIAHGLLVEFELMTETQATAEIFYTALKALPKIERDAVIVRIANDKSLARDLMDLATIAQRRNEPSRPFRQYLSARRTKK